MRPEHVDETLLVRFLLGHLTEEEAVRVEDRAFADAEFLGTLEAAEADLIDSYVAGGLAQADRRAFEQRFLVSPQRRSKVEFARALSRVAAETRPVEAPVRRRNWASLFGMGGGWQWAGAAASMVFLAAAAGLMMQNAGMRTQLAGLEAERRSLQARADDAQRQLGAERDRNASLQQQQAPGDRTAAPPALLVLLPGLSRAEAKMPDLRLNPASPLARIEVNVEARDDFPRFRAELRTRSGAEVLSQANLVRRQSAGAYAIRFEVPTSLLAPGEYELTLKGVAAGKPAEDIGFYYFRVAK